MPGTNSRAIPDIIVGMEQMRYRMDKAMSIRVKATSRDDKVDDDVCSRHATIFTPGPRDRANPHVVPGTRLYSEVVQSLPSPTHHAQSNPQHTQHDVRQHEQTVTETARDISAAKWPCEEDPHHVSYQLAEHDDSVADQWSDGSSRHTDDQTDDDKTGSYNAGLCYTEEGCPAVTNRDSKMTTTSVIEQPEVMSGATTCYEEVIAAPQTAASDTDTETKATKETKDGNKGKKTEADENLHTHNADEERVPPNTPPTPLNSKPSAALGESPQLRTA
ncbi:hypothetical protein ACOMHN_057956 [Nucella lapillus]